MRNPKNINLNMINSLLSISKLPTVSNTTSEDFRAGYESALLALKAVALDLPYDEVVERENESVSSSSSSLSARIVYDLNKK